MKCPPCSQKQLPKDTKEREKVACDKTINKKLRVVHNINKMRFVVKHRTITRKELKQDGK